MILYNQTKTTIIVSDLRIAKSWVDKSLGLLKKKGSRSILIKTRFGIHTFFLKEPIDIIVLNNSLQVVKAKTVKPNSLFFYNPLCVRVIELPKNTIDKTQTKIGDYIEIKG